MTISAAGSILPLHAIRSAATTTRPPAGAAPTRRDGGCARATRGLSLDGSCLPWHAPRQAAAAASRQAAHEKVVRA